MENAKLPIKFDIYEGATLVRTEILTEQTIKVGKLSSSHVRIDDEDVSRMHAVVEANGPDDVVVLDLGSASGTFVNGQRVTRQKLRSGDELRFGRVRVVIDIPGQSTAAPLDSASFSQTARVRPAELSKAARRPAPVFKETTDDLDEASKRCLEVLVMWGGNVLEVRHLTEAGTFTIGEAEKVDHFVPGGLPQDPYPLAETDGHEMVVNVPDGIPGEVMLDGQVFKLEELKAAGKLGASRGVSGSQSLKLPSRARCRVQFGHLTFLIGNVPAAKTLPAPGLLARGEGRFIGGVLSALLLHGLFFGVAMSIPEDADRLALDGFDMSERWVEYVLKPEMEKDKKLEDLFKDLKDEAAEAAAAAKENEGKAGKKDSLERDKRMAIKGPPDQKEIEVAKERDKQRAIQTADAIHNALEDELSAVWGKNDHAVGSDAVNALGNMFGDQVGEAQGFAGMGVAGMGRGGGGFSETSLGVGGPRTMGRGGAGGDGTSYGRGVSRYGERTSKAPQVIPGQPIISGSLDREIIRRIIRQHRAEYQYCYEKELNKKRDLNGKIVVKFTIAGNGSVIQASVVESSMGNADVESCLTARIQRWVFPEPKGGGMVVVNYPFVFKPS